ncbi:MAG: carbohydrate kinase family protein [Anaerolineales bacterium]|nr:carbohydrate kinase family protein [Anaerolineales bacterium]MCB8951414.1 carbohydrate kinase family protein [Ardenticatenales bacterium]
MKIVVTGSIAYDYLMFFPGKFTDHLLPDHLHNVNLSFLVDSMKRQRGGNAPNIGYTMGLLHGRPTVMATAGQDFGEYRTWLEKHGVDTSGIVEIEDEYCASFFVSTDENQNQIASFYTGAMAHANKLTFAQYAPDADLAIISPNDPAAMSSYVRECKRLGIDYIYDPSQQTVRLSADDLREGVTGCRLLTTNEYEFNLIQEKTGLKQDDIMALAGGLLITHGKQGSTIYVNGETYHIPPVPPLGVTEPTGAGDAFRGGLIRGMQMGLPWAVSGRMGALAATYVLENFGTQSHRFTVAEFVSRYRQHFDDDGALDTLLRDG